MLELKEGDGRVTLRLRVQPRSSRDAIEGEWNGALKVRLMAPPADGRANEACCRLLAGRLKIPPSAVRILAGERSRNKQIEIRGVTPQQVMSLLGNG